MAAPRDSRAGSNPPNPLDMWTDLLAATGKLNAKMGGRPVRIPIEKEVYDLIFSEPFMLDQPRNSQGYRAGSEQIRQELRRLWTFLVQMHELGRPRVAIPPP